MFFQSYYKKHLDGEELTFCGDIIESPSRKLAMIEAAKKGCYIKGQLVCIIDAETGEEKHFDNLN